MGNWQPLAGLLGMVLYAADQQTRCRGHLCSSMKQRRDLRLGGRAAQREDEEKTM